MAKKSSKAKKKRINMFKMAFIAIILAAAGTGAFFAYGYFGVTTYDITIYAGGSQIAQTIDTSRGLASAAPNAPELTGYSFEGWYLDENYTEPLDFSSYKIKGSLEVYAKYSIIMYTITLNTGEGSAIEPISYEYSAIPSEPDYPLLDSYLFTGWYSDAACTEKLEFDEAYNADFTAYAGWAQASDCLTYSVNAGMVTITGYKAGIPKLLTIPETIDDKSVINLASSAFSGCTKITELVITSETLNIGSSVFSGCSSLSKIHVFLKDSYMPSSYSYLAYYFGSSATDVPSSLKTVIINEGTTGISTNAFAGCENITKVYLPETVVRLDNGAFAYCTSLEKLVLPSEINTIGDSAFSYCFALDNITLPEGLLKIPYSAFSYCTNLRNITLPNSLVEIEMLAFAYCQRLSAIDLPDSVTAIGINAFNFCTGLLSVSLPSGITKIEIGTFTNCTSLTSAILPSGLITIDSIAFQSCKALATIAFPSTLSTLSSSAFYDCTALDNIVLPGSLTTIGGGAFALCSSLHNLTISEGITTLPSGAFAVCDSLTSVTLPSTITSISYDAFDSSDNIMYLTVLSVTPPVISGLSLPAEITAIYVPSGSVNSYKSASGWSAFSTKIQAVS